MSGTVKINVDASALEATLADLYSSLETILEVPKALFDILDSGEELFRVDCDVLPASIAGEVLVRLHPSDALSCLVAASRARDVDFCIFEHAPSPVGISNVSTTSKLMQ